MIISRFILTVLVCGVASWVYAQGPGAGKGPGGPGPGPQLGGGLPIFGPPPGVALFQKNCASCHTAEGLEMNGRIAPAIPALNATAPERTFEALSTGKMKDQAASLTNREKRDLSEYLARRPIPQPAAADVSKMANPCSSNPPLMDLTAVPSWSGWGAGANNARFQTERSAGLNAADVPKLKLKWAVCRQKSATPQNQRFSRVIQRQVDAPIHL